MTDSSNANAVRRLLASYHHRRGRNLISRNQLASAHRHFAKAGQYGHADALYRLGKNYIHGLGCVRSGSAAMRWFELAAASGHREAKFELALILLNDHDRSWCAGSSARWAEALSNSESPVPSIVFPGGLSIQKDDHRAYLLLREAAEGGMPEAQANLGWLLLKGVGCEPNVTEAKRWFLRAVGSNISQAALGLAEVFGSKDSAHHDAAEHFQWLQKAADLGNVSAAYRFGLLLQTASDSENRIEDVKKYFSFAAEHNHAASAFALGVVLLSGSPEQAQIEKATDYLRVAAKAGHTHAAAILGELYSKGEASKPNPCEAMYWLRRAADGGHIQAQFQVGCGFARGEGVPQDLNHAVRYFQMSAQGGHAIAALNAGIFYERGEGVKQNLEEAIRLFRIAALGGLVQGQIRLAQLLASGKNGTVDIISAIELLESAIGQGSEEAELVLSKILLLDASVANCRRVDSLLTSLVGRKRIEAAEAILELPESFTPSETAVSTALNLIEAAAKAGSSRAMVLMARELFKGRYLPHNASHGELLLEKAADANDPIANFELGVLWCNRKRGQDELAKGFDFFVRAAELGHAVAQFNAGIMILNGTGVSNDFDLATRFLKKASDQGLEQAFKVIQNLDNRGSADRRKVVARGP